MNDKQLLTINLNSKGYCRRQRHLAVTKRNYHRRKAAIAAIFEAEKEVKRWDEILRQAKNV